jgi:HSP20 family protein
MKILTRWNQLKEQDALRYSLGRLFNRSQIERRKGIHAKSMAVAQWSPQVDISEDDNEYLISAELPGVRKEDLKITADKGSLIILGERKSDPRENGKTFCQVERSHGIFGRSFSLPDNANPTQISAEFRDGVLVIRLAKNGNS